MRALLLAHRATMPHTAASAKRCDTLTRLPRGDAPDLRLTFRRTHPRAPCA
jgi:hypothetical protein